MDCDSDRLGDSNEVTCEQWCRPVHCRKWCKCKGCAKCQNNRCVRNVHGMWSRRPERGFRFKEPCIDRHRGTPAHFEPSNCTIAQKSSSAVRGRLLFVGDSLMHFQFEALISWLQRSGRQMHCKPAAPALFTPATPKSGMTGLAARIDALTYVNRYKSVEME